MTQEIKPCLYCGGGMETVVKCISNNCFYDYVFCLACCASGSRILRKDDDLMISINEAIAAHNAAWERINKEVEE